MSDNHPYILLADKPRKGANTEAGFLIIDFFFRNKQPRNKWHKDKQLYQIKGQDKGGNIITSKPINYLEIARYIREKGNFSSHEFT